MGLLRDTVHDALRPLPGAPVVRRSASGDWDEAADDGALTVYRFQKDGGERPPLAPPRGPSTVGGGVPSGTAVAGGVAIESIVHPVIGLNVGFERSEEIPPVAHPRMSLSSSLSEASPDLEFPARSDPGSVPVPPSPALAVDAVRVSALAPAQRQEASYAGSQVARGAPSGNPPRAPALSTNAPAETRSALQGARTQGRATSTPAEARPDIRASDGGLRIGRIEVTVLADAPRPAPTSSAGSLAESRFLSRHYVRRT